MVGHSQVRNPLLPSPLPGWLYTAQELTAEYAVEGLFLGYARDEDDEDDEQDEDDIAVDLKGKKHVDTEGQNDHPYHIHDQPETVIAQWASSERGMESEKAMRLYLRTYVPYGLIKDEFGEVKDLATISRRNIAQYQAILWRDAPRSRVDHSELIVEAVTDTTLLVAQAVSMIAAALADNYVFIAHPRSATPYPAFSCRMAHQQLNLPIHADAVALEPYLAWETLVAEHKVTEPDQELLIYSRRPPGRYDPVDLRRFLPEEPLVFCLECLRSFWDDRQRAREVLDQYADIFKAGLETWRVKLGGRPQSEAASAHDVRAHSNDGAWPDETSFAVDGVPINPQRHSKSVGVSSQLDTLHGKDHLAAKSCSPPSQTLVIPLNNANAFCYTKEAGRVSFDSQSQMAMTPKIGWCYSVELTRPKEQAQQASANAVDGVNGWKAASEYSMEQLIPNTHAGVDVGKPHEHEYEPDIKVMASHTKDLGFESPHRKSVYFKNRGIPRFTVMTEAERAGTSIEDCHFAHDKTLHRENTPLGSASSQITQIGCDPLGRPNTLSQRAGLSPVTIGSHPGFPNVTVSKAVKQPHSPPILTKRQRYKANSNQGLMFVRPTWRPDDPPLSSSYTEPKPYFPSAPEIICACRKPPQTPTAKIAQCVNTHCRARWYHYNCLTKAEKVSALHGTLLCELCKGEQRWEAPTKATGFPLPSLTEEAVRYTSASGPKPLLVQDPYGLASLVAECQTPAVVEPRTFAKTPTCTNPPRSSSQGFTRTKRLGRGMKSPMTCLGMSEQDETSWEGDVEFKNE